MSNKLLTNYCKPLNFRGQLSKRENKGRKYCVCTRNYTVIGRQVLKTQNLRAANMSLLKNSNIKGLAKI